MAGERDLDTLIASMAPELMDSEYVFCSFPNARYGDHAALEPVAAMVEAEGLTLVIPRARADEAAIDYESVFRGITLRVHSSLDAVGLTAAFARALGDEGISANVIAGYFHDHIFVQGDRASAAMAALEALARAKRGLADAPGEW